MFTGTGVALVTPFLPDGSIDFEGLAKVIDAVTLGGVDYLVALGTTAETPTLSSEEKLQVLQFILDHNQNKKPVVVGIGGNNTQDMLHTLSRYPLDRISGILSVVPYYNKPSQEGIYRHFKMLAEHTEKPIILYNVPGRTATNILPHTAIRLAHEFKHIVAIKEASGNIAQCMELVQHAPAHFQILSGDDNLVLAHIAIGMKGVISVAANCYAKTFSILVRHALNNEFEAARRLHYQLLERINLLFAEGNPTGVKYVLNQQGLIQNVLRLPMVPASEQLAEAFTQAGKE